MLIELLFSFVLSLDGAEPKPGSAPYFIFSALKTSAYGDRSPHNTLTPEAYSDCDALATASNGHYLS